VEESETVSNPERGRGVLARQAAVIALASAVATFVALTDTTRGPLAVALVAGLHVVVAAVLAVVAPGWDRTPQPRALLPVAMLLLVTIGLTSFVTDGYASGTGPLVVLVFAWVGLHGGRRSLLALVPWSVLTYLLPLVATDARPRLMWSTVVLVPIATVLALLVHDRVEAQRRTQGLLESRERWRAALMATLAHDVRAPLSSVTGTLEIFEDDPQLDDRYRPLLAGAMRQTQRVVRLATGILEVERVEHGALVLDRRDVPVADLAEDVRALTRPTDVTVEVEPGLTVDADRDRLEQVLFNLTNNALRHGRPPVVISASRTGDGAVEVAVEDHGNGVPAPDVAALFDRFSSADRSPHSVGLGLWIVRTLVEAHGGTIRYESPREGARFVVRLPAAAPAVEHAVRSSA
jgi:signal transduction histidine kinase